MTAPNIAAGGDTNKVRSAKMKKSTAKLILTVTIPLVIFTAPITLDAIGRAWEGDGYGPVTLRGRWWGGVAWIAGILGDQKRMEAYVSRAWAIDEGRVEVYYDISFSIEEHLKFGRDVRDIDGISGMGLFTDLASGELRITIPKNERDHLVSEIRKRFNMTPRG